jgi:hypothetical protein
MGKVVFIELLVDITCNLPQFIRTTTQLCQSRRQHWRRIQNLQHEKSDFLRKERYGIFFTSATNVKYVASQYSQMTSSVVQNLC